MRDGLSASASANLSWMARPLCISLVHSNLCTFLAYLKHDHLRNAFLQYVISLSGPMSLLYSMIQWKLSLMFCIWRELYGFLSTIWLQVTITKIIFWKCYYITQHNTVNVCLNRLPIWFYNNSRRCWFWLELGKDSQPTTSLRPVRHRYSQNTASHSNIPPVFLSFSARTAQRQCCLGSLKESHCFSGMNAARKGTVCEVDNNDQCGADSYKVKVLPMVLLVGWCYTRVVGLIPT